ncbi:MAG: hypothetical protein M5R36_02395 [Deltaproteobacteria bacterium]|nr:hypothetical protein [Deltaproteobacteria bacterium]
MAPKTVRRSQIAEAVLIALSFPLAFAAGSGRVLTPTLTEAVALVAGVLFAQSLVRDMVRLVIRRRSGAAEKFPCLCVETSLALVAGGAAFLLAALGVSEPVALGSFRLAALVAGTLAVGFLTKDYVVTVRRVEDHGGIAW